MTKPGANHKSKPGKQSSRPAIPIPPTSKANGDGEFWQQYRQFVEMTLGGLSILIETANTEEQVIPTRQVIVGVRREELDNTKQANKSSAGGSGYEMTSHIVVSYEEQPDLKQFVLNNLTVLFPNATPEPATPYHFLINKLNNVPLSQITGGFMAQSFLADLISKIISEQDTFTFDEEVARRHYLKFRDFVNGDTLTMRDVLTFQNMELGVDSDQGQEQARAVLKLELLPKVWIRNPRSQDYALYANGQTAQALERLGEAERFNTFFRPLLEIELTLSRTPVANKISLPRMRYVTELLLLALRLYKGGAVGLQPVFTYVVDYPDTIPVMTLNITTSSYPDQAHVYGKVYRLGSTELTDFKQFWDSLIDLQPVLETKLSMPVERFTTSYTQARPLSRLLELVVGLESIFSEGPASLTYKYALRAAVATGRSFEERVAINRRLKLAYTLRSKAAHGDQALPKEARPLFKGDAEANEKLEEFIEGVRRVLARALVVVSRWYLNNPNGKLSQFLTELDEALLATGAYPLCHWPTLTQAQENG